MQPPYQTRRKTREGEVAHHHRVQRIIWWVLVAWVCAACLGILFQLVFHIPHEIPDSVPRVVEALLRSFDSLFKLVGGLFVAIVWSVRIAIKSVLYRSSVSVSSSEHIWFPAALYTCHGMIRAWIYKTHSVFLQTHEALGHMMSDHVLLSSSIVAGLVCEMYLILTSKAVRDRRVMGTELVGQRFIIHTIVGTLSLVLALLIIHVYRTARYYHTPQETMASVILGSFLFKLTSYYSLSRRFVPMFQ